MSSDSLLTLVFGVMTVDRNLDELAADELAADYVAGNLSAATAERFARLLVEQPELRQTVRQLEAGVELLLTDLPLMEPPPHLAAAILAAADTATAADMATAAPTPNPAVLAAPATMRPTGSRLLVVTLGLIAASATALAFTFGLSNQRLRLANKQLNQALITANQGTNTAQEAQVILHQQGTRFYDFEGTDAAQTAFGNMVVDTDGLRAAIAFQNLPPLPTNQTYALWVIRDGGYIFCGNFNTDTTGETFVTLSMPTVYQARPWVKEVMVTIEPQTGDNQTPASPSGPVVAETI